jgi:FKBP-type peptidyl-prolyl cis-trans isomerase
MKKTILIVASLASVLSACKQSKYPGYELSETGLYYKIEKENKDAKKPTVGDIITVDLVLSNSLNDSVIFDSRKFEKSQKFPLFESKYKGSIEEGFAMLGEGDSASFIINPDSFYSFTTQQPRPKFLKEGAMLKFAVKLKKVESKEEYKAEQAKKDLEALSAELAKLNEYLSSKNITAKPDSTGLYYIETKSGSGALAQSGDSVVVHYEGTLLDGKVFDSSIGRGEPISFSLGRGMVIPGWEIGLSKMKKGAEATLIIPSKLAYGPRGMGPIPPAATLVFKVQLINIVKKK